MGNYTNEIEQFIYEICYMPMWEAVNAYITQHPYVLDLKYSKIKYPDSVLLEDMVLQFPTNIRATGDTLSFDAVVSCTLNLTEENYRGLGSCDIDQWLTVSCKAVIKEKLESLEIAEISQYSQGRSRKADGQHVSKNIVPIIYKNDLEQVATDFLNDHCPEALKTPMKVPIEDIAESMGLEIIRGHRLSDDFSVFGEICFSAGTVQVCDLFKCSHYDVTVRRGSILIDACTFWQRNIGCVNNTIAHEVIHWDKHRLYAAVKQLLRKEKVISCRCPTDMVYPVSNEEWTDEQRMEWQANSLAPRILMPLEPFKKKVDEYYLQYRYAESDVKPQVLVCVADDLARFFGVSRQSALLRMVEAGYKEAVNLCQFARKQTLHSYIDREEAFYIYSTDPEFRGLIDSGLFKYIDGYFVINDKLYVAPNADGRLILTDYAWEHLQECTLQFDWHTIRRSDPRKHLPQKILHRANAQQEVSRYSRSNNSEAIEAAKRLEQKRLEFEKQNSMRKIVTPNKSCWQMLHDIIQARGLSKPHFCNLTGLDEVYYRRAETNPDTKPSKRAIVAVACGLDIDLDTTNKLLQLAGHAFEDSDEDNALKFCITGFIGQPIDEANEFLSSYGYAPLGTQQRK